MAVKPRLNSGYLSKFIVSAMGTAITGLNTYYSGSHWVPIVSEALTALGVYLVPNLATSNPSVNQETPPVA